MQKNLLIFLLYSLIGSGTLHASDNHSIIYVDGLPITLTNEINNGFFIDDSKADTIHIPIIRVGNLLVIEAQIDEQIGNFILDLGAPYLVLNTTYFRNYVIDNSYTSGTLVSENDYTRRTKVDELTFFGLNIKNLTADVTDLGAIENKRNIKILGLLGVALFKEYVFDLDLSKQQLNLYKKFNKTNIQSSLILETEIQVKNNVIILDAQSNGESLRFSIDTGAERNILDNRLSEKVYEGMKVLNASIITDGNGQSSEALIASVDNINVANVNIGKSPTIIINLEIIRRAYNNKIDGMLGFPFFALGRVIIDFKNEALFIYHNNRTE